ncbi:peptide chain release factor 2 [hydrocarbon metagenome]|uniref:Peptide chain release factor 2 n=1 Tax=hydrocarbon metagenome TaxID=938273 RepID=A0A0W8E5B7_9ZZZZ
MQEKTIKPGFWDDNQQAQSILKEISDLQDIVKQYQDLYNNVGYIKDMLEIAEEENEEELISETIKELEQVQEKFKRFELLFLFSGEHDHNNAIVSLHAGAGGTEAQDWVEMLLRMYTRWAEATGYKVQIMDLLAGDEAGVKSVTFLVTGNYAYGKLRCEQGVHRLIRISPFDSSGRRHTSFASLSVLPDIDEEVEIGINTEDLRIDTYRSGGAGGQHVNKTDSAVRITHIPSGIVVQCQNERSQLSNRMAAMKILTARLYELKQKEMESSMEGLKGEYKEIAWGSQIRTYTLNPFNLIKDHRTNVETGNVQAVLDGDLDDYIYACLMLKNNW